MRCLMYFISTTFRIIILAQTGIVNICAPPTSLRTVCVHNIYAILYIYTRIPPRFIVPLNLYIIIYTFRGARETILLSLLLIFPIGNAQQYWYGVSVQHYLVQNLVQIITTINSVLLNIMYIVYVCEWSTVLILYIIIRDTYIVCAAGSYSARLFTVWV